MTHSVLMLWSLLSYLIIQDQHALTSVRSNSIQLQLSGSGIKKYLAMFNQISWTLLEELKESNVKAAMKRMLLRKPNYNKS
jgi:hypothetical protein